MRDPGPTKLRAIPDRIDSADVCFEALVDQHTAVDFDERAPQELDVWTNADRESHELTGDLVTGTRDHRGGAA